MSREIEPERRRGAPRALSGDQNAMVTCPRLETRLPARCRCPERSGLVAESVRRCFASWRWAPHFVFGLSAFFLSPHHHRHPRVPPLSSPRVPPPPLTSPLLFFTRFSSLRSGLGLDPHPHRRANLYVPRRREPTALEAALRKTPSSSTPTSPSPRLPHALKAASLASGSSSTPPSPRSSLRLARADL